MMQANELRIGNIVNTEYGILSMHASMLVDIANNGFKVEPLPLTPEILEKAGFKLILNYYEGKGVSVIQLEGRYFLHNYYLKQVEIKHLHQLQNLYFALTGEELEINL